MVGVGPAGRPTVRWPAGRGRLRAGAGWRRETARAADQVPRRRWCAAGRRAGGRPGQRAARDWHHGRSARPAGAGRTRAVHRPGGRRPAVRAGTLRPGQPARAAGRPDRGVGGRRHLRAVQERPGAGEPGLGGHLREGVRRAPAGAVLQVGRLAGGRAGRPGQRAGRLRGERARAGTGRGAERGGRTGRLHHLQRPELPVDRGGEPALPAAGQDLPGRLRGRAVDPARLGSA